jgi:hypothetical protein
MLDLDRDGEGVDGPMRDSPNGVLTSNKNATSCVVHGGGGGGGG